MSTALTRQNELTPTHWDMIRAVANSVYESRKFGVVKAQEAEIKLLTAWENGFPLTSALSVVHVINGIPALSPKAVWARIVQHPDFAGYKEEQITDSKGAFAGWRISLKRHNGVEATRQFTLDDAKRAGLADKDNWKNYPHNMCYWRAMGFAEDVVFPDVSLGMARADELGAAVTEDGSVIDGAWHVEEEQLPHNGQAPDQATLLQELLAKFGADAIMRANDGMIPATVDEVIAVAAKLNGGESDA